MLTSRNWITSQRNVFILQTHTGNELTQMCQATVGVEFLAWLVDGKKRIFIFLYFIADHSALKADWVGIM
jgi:hypothetical protein